MLSKGVCPSLPAGALLRQAALRRSKACLDRVSASRIPLYAKVEVGQQASSNKSENRPQSDTALAQPPLETSDKHRVTITQTERSTAEHMCQSDTRHLPAASLTSQKAPPNYRVIAAAAYPSLQPAQQLSSAVLLLFSVHFPTKTSARKACRRGEIFVNGQAQGTGCVVGPGDSIEFAQRDSQNRAGRARQMQPAAQDCAQVLYEDGHLACVIRPPGCSLQGDWDGRPNVQLQLASSTEVGVLQQPQPLAYRLDGEIGGLALVAKTKLAFQQLSTAFEHREVSKHFLALVGGRLQGRGMVEVPLDGMPCASAWRAVNSVQSSRHGWVTTIALQPLTVHRNQLRRHMALIGNPVIGDTSFTYSLAKQYITHQKLPATPGMQELEYNANDCCRSENECSNSASVALQRMGRGLAADRVQSDQHSGSLAMQRLEFEARHARSSRTRKPHHHLQHVQAGSWPGLARNLPQRPLSGHPLCLWASTLSLTHPSTGELLTLQTAEPDMFEDVRQAEVHAQQQLDQRLARLKSINCDRNARKQCTW